ncbi:hypothetical protein R1flu_026055 [Riccia fluitans]|uniref:Uncharacterized protein n=1 Tax=Riccia fluitans TaxID=41844 RepID=A0ABD1XEV9_9MARC
MIHSTSLESAHLLFAYYLNEQPEALPTHVKCIDLHKYLEAMKPVMATMKLVTNETGRSPEAPDCTAGPGAGAGAAAMATPMLEKATAATMAKATADRMVKAMTEIVSWDKARREIKHERELRAQLCFDDGTNLCRPK